MKTNQTPHIQYVGDNIPDIEEFLGIAVEVDDNKGDFFYFNGRVGFSVNLGDYLVYENSRVVVMPPTVFESMYKTN